MTLPDMRDCQCSVCGWKGRIKLTSREKRCGGCGVRHFVSAAQWIAHLDGDGAVLMLDNPDRRGKRGRDKMKRARPRWRSGP